MKGGIYSNERCPVCGSTFKDDGRTGLYCPNHPKIKASRCFVIFGGICKRFKSYDAADYFLNGVRFKTTENTFDERDYRKDNPLGFSNMAARWLKYKQDEVRQGSFKNIRRHIEIASTYFEQTNVKDIKYGPLEDFLKSIKLSDKSKSNIISTIHAFYVWMKKRQEIKEIPEFPPVSFELGYRKTVDKDTQWQVIEEVARICPNPKVALGIRLLSTYFSVRPVEMLRIKEGDIDLENRYIYFPHPKEKKYKAVPILQCHVDEIKPLTGQVSPAMPFFRHLPGFSGCSENQPFGEKYLYKWWVKACRNLGIVGVDLYGGTRHSTVRALRKNFSPEQIKQAAMSSTNKAFDRYMGRPEDDDIRSIYQESAEVIPIDKGLIRRKTV